MRSPSLGARYDETSSQYRHPYSGQPWISEHCVGVFSPGPDPVSHVRVHLVSMSQPRHVNGYEPVIPYLVPLLSRGDSSIGITLAPGTEELWVIGYTATGSDGTLQAGRFVPPDQMWRGLPWELDYDERLRFRYEIVYDGHAPIQFTVLLFAEGDTLHCKLEG